MGPCRAKSPSSSQTTGRTDDTLGGSVAISGDTLVVGADFARVGDHESQGAAYVFTRSGTTWTQQAKLVADDGAAFDYFGCSVALSGDTLIVGARGAHGVGENWDQGAAYVFTRSGATWTAADQAQSPTTAHRGTRFGFSVALADDTAVIGAWADDVGANDITGLGVRVRAHRRLPGPSGEAGGIRRRGARHLRLLGRDLGRHGGRRRRRS